MKEDIMIILKAGQEEGDLIDVLINQAKSLIRGYCFIDEIPESLDGAVTEITVILYNRLGSQGETSHTEGDIAIGFSDGLPSDIRAILDNYRKGRVSRF